MADKANCLVGLSIKKQNMPHPHTKIDKTHLKLKMDCCLPQIEIDKTHLQLKMDCCSPQVQGQELTQMVADLSCSTPQSSQSVIWLLRCPSLAEPARVQTNGSVVHFMAKLGRALPCCGEVPWAVPWAALQGSATSRTVTK